VELVKRFSCSAAEIDGGAEGHPHAKGSPVQGDSAGTCPVVLCLVFPVAGVSLRALSRGMRKVRPGGTGAARMRPARSLPAGWKRLKASFQSGRRLRKGAERCGVSSLRRATGREKRSRRGRQRPRGQRVTKRSQGPVPRRPSPGANRVLMRWPRV